MISPRKPSNYVIPYTIIPKLRNFKNFLWLTWKHLGLPDPTDVQYDIADYLDNGPNRRVIEAFRGIGKSWITSTWCVHKLYLYPWINIMANSASKTRSDDFSTFSLRIIKELPFLAPLIPQEGQRESKIAFDVGPAPASHSPSLKSIGITGMITGSRADVIVADDVESQNNSQTQTMRDKLGESIKEFEAVLKPGGHIVFLGTPQSEMSIYNYLPERGYSKRIWPARYPTMEQRKSYAGYLAPSIEKKCLDTPEIIGTSTDPKRFSDMELKVRQDSYGKSGFSLQFMLDTKLSDVGRYPLKLRDLIVMDLNIETAPEKLIWTSDPSYMVRDVESVGLHSDRYFRPAAVTGDWIPYTGSLMAIDPSGKGKDETAYAIIKILNSQLFLVDAGGFTDGYSEATLTALAQAAARHKVNNIVVEENFGGGMFKNLLIPHLRTYWQCNVEEVRSSVQKERRLCDTLEPVMNSHRLIVDKALIRKDFSSTQQLQIDDHLRYQLFYQMSRITRDKGALTVDDRLDALAIAVAFWADNMATTVDDQMAERKKALFDEHCKKFEAYQISNIIKFPNQPEPRRSPLFGSTRVR